MGFTLNRRKCVDIDECSEFRGLCKGKLHCTNTVGSYACGCRRGYNTAIETSDRDFNMKIPVCVDIDECSKRETCSVNSVCRNTAGSYSCQCETGFQGILCEDIDECVLVSSCHSKATCSNSYGSYSCFCNKGYQGDGQTCQCPPGFEGENCTADIDECERNLFDCDGNAICLNNKGNYECNCKSGYHGDGTTCKKGDCNSMSCPVNQKCVSPTSDECECKEKFILDKSKNVCEDIDECVMGHDCHPNSICANFEGGYNCTCDSGYFGNGKTCQEGSCTDDMCSLNEECVSPRGSNCRCKEGFEVGQTGVCEDTDECFRDTDGCDGNATCTNKIGGYSCSCNTKFEGDGFSCDSNECEANYHDCHANATCTNTIGGFNCSCISDFDGNGTSCDLNECLTNGHDCSYDANCTNTIGSYACSCETESSCQSDWILILTLDCGWDSGLNYGINSGYDSGYDFRWDSVWDSKLEFSWDCTSETVWNASFASNKALLINNDKSKGLGFDSAGKDIVGSCSLVWRGEMFLFGGNDYRPEIYVVDGCGLKGTQVRLNFDMYFGACAQRDNSEIFICFPDVSNDDTKQRCWRATDPLKKFEPLTNSNYDHRATQIAVTSG